MDLSGLQGGAVLVWGIDGVQRWQASSTMTWMDLFGGGYLDDSDFAEAGIMTTDGAGNYGVIPNWGDHSLVGYLTDADITNVLVDQDFTQPGIMTTNGSGVYNIIPNNGVGFLKGDGSGGFTYENISSTGVYNCLLYTSPRPRD